MYKEKPKIAKNLALYFLRLIVNEKKAKIYIKIYSFNEQKKYFYCYKLHLNKQNNKTIALYSSD